MTGIRTDPVRADGRQPGRHFLTYTLGGADAASFDIVRATGQLKTKAKLDYETKKSYMVTVTATDPDGASASIDVTIMVTERGRSADDRERRPGNIRHEQRQLRGEPHGRGGGVHAGRADEGHGLAGPWRETTPLTSRS